MASTIELHRTTYNALIVEQWEYAKGITRGDDAMLYIYIYIFLKEKSDRKAVGLEEKGKPLYAEQQTLSLTTFNGGVRFRETAPCFSVSETHKTKASGSPRRGRDKCREEKKGPE